MTKEANKEKDKAPSASPADNAAAQPPSELDEFFRSLKPEMRRPRPGPDAVAAAVESAQRLAAHADTEQAAEDAAEHGSSRHAARRTVGGESICVVCGYKISPASRFCGMCGVALEGVVVAGTVKEGTGGDSSLHAAASSGDHPIGTLPPPAADPRAFIAERHANGHPETHHYHHHYHHHFFNGAPEGVPTAVPARAAADPARDLERLRSSAALRGDMSREEAAVRRLGHEWVLACNTKHLDDMLELYSADAMVLRSNYPPIRGAAAVREFFFSALDAGLGEVELEPLRIDVVGELAYEAGRCKALVPSASGKRREERGKYLWICSRQSGEWKLVADCWSSDLALTSLETDVPSGAGVRSAQPRKS